MNKRNQKTLEKAKLKNLADPLFMNKSGNNEVLFKALKNDSSKEKCPYTPLRDTVNKVLTDMDPDQGLEEEYMNKNDTVFCWKFLRQTAYVD